jgi:hypothetical protein
MSISETSQLDCWRYTMKEHAMARVNGIFSDGLFVPPLVIPSLTAVVVLLIAAYKFLAY